MWTDTIILGLTVETRRVPQTVEGVGSVSRLGIAVECSGLKGAVEDMLGLRGEKGNGPSLSWQIACLCGS